MYKLIRFYNQNRDKIIKTILIIVFIIGIIQLLNYMAKNNKTKNNNIQKENNTINYTNEGLASNKSSITGQKVSVTKLKKDASVINDFIDFCNNGKIEHAYNMLTDECKEEMYGSVNQFKNLYYDNIFQNKEITPTIENWINDTYKVKMVGDLLSTGIMNEIETKQDYITIKRQGDSYKLNINNYIGRTELNKKQSKSNINITVIRKDLYIDYEEYTIKVENNTESDILLDTKQYSDSMYIKDSKEMKYASYNHELTDADLLVSKNHEKNLKIKYYSPFNSEKRIQKLVFSNIILEYGKSLDRINDKKVEIIEVEI